MPKRRRTSTVHARPADFESFVTSTSASLGRLQLMLREAFEETLPPGSGARACGRRLGVGTTLGWKAWSLAYAPDTAAALARLPGPMGWKMLLAAFAKAGLPASKVERLGEVARELQKLLSSTETTPSALRSMAAGGLSTTSETAAFVRARRNARSAAETTHGVRCGLNVVATIVGPPKAGHRCDLATASLFAGLERLRPGLPWAIYRWGIQVARGRHSAGGKAISRSELAPLVPELSTPDIDRGALRRVDAEARASIEFVDAGSIEGRSLDATFIESSRNRGFLAPPDEVLASAMVVTVPIERAIVDVLLHRDVPYVEFPTGGLYSAFDPMMWVRKGGSQFLLQESCRMPLEREPKTVDSLRLPAPWSRGSGTYAEAVRRAVGSLGHGLDEFKIIRLEVPDPPLHGMVVIRWRTP